MVLTTLPRPGRDRVWRAAEVRALPDDGVRYEVVRGALLVSPSPRPRHQRILRRLLAELSNYLAPHNLDDAIYMAPADISWDEETLVQPDLFVVAPSEMYRDWEQIKTLLLVIEVLSPATALYDQNVKRRIYQEHGVGTYWVVDPDRRSIDVWHPDDEIPCTERNSVRWRFSAEAPELVIDVATMTR